MSIDMQGVFGHHSLQSTPFNYQIFHHGFLAQGASIDF